MNLVVIARRPEIAERGAATIQALTGKHPSRTIVVQSADPDGPSWIDARVEAHCILPREDAPETFAETIPLIAAATLPIAGLPGASKAPLNSRSG